MSLAKVVLTGRNCFKYEAPVTTSTNAVRRGGNYPQRLGSGTWDLRFRRQPCCPLGSPAAQSIGLGPGDVERRTEDIIAVTVNGLPRPAGLYAP